MTWDPARLTEWAARRAKSRVKVEPLEAAVLAYARWQGLTAETGVDRDQQKAVLDGHLDRLEAMEPEVWLGVAALAEDLGDATLLGLMRYSMARGRKQLREQTVALQGGGDTGPSRQRGRARKPRRDRQR